MSTASHEPGLPDQALDCAPAGPLPVRAVVQVDAYRIIRRAVEDGVAYGIRRAWKHHDDPLPLEREEELADALCTAVLAELCDVLRFPAGTADGDPQ